MPSEDYESVVYRCPVCNTDHYGEDERDDHADEWTPAEVYEAREHGVSKITRADGKEWWS